MSFKHGKAIGRNQDQNIGKKIVFCYWTRHMTQTRHRYLFKNKGNFVYNYKLKKYMHMIFTPMLYEFKDMQKFKQNLWKNFLA